MKTKNTKKFVVNALESILVIGYILFEELIWNVFAKPIYQNFKSLVALDALKSTFLAMNRYFLLTVFIFIFAVAELMGFVSAFFIMDGYIFSGIIIYTLKIPIAAFTFWLFDLTKKQLMSFKWLKAVYQYVMDLIGKFVHLDVYIYIKTRIKFLKEKMTQLVLKHLGEQGFLVSIKAHYTVFKQYFKNIKTFAVLPKTTKILSENISDKKNVV